MCVCTPNKRTPVCDDCPPDVKAEWGRDKPRGHEPKKTPLDIIAHALAIIASAMDEGGIDKFDLTYGKYFKFSGHKRKALKND